MEHHWKNCINVGGDCFERVMFNEIYLVCIIFFIQSENFLNRLNKFLMWAGGTWIYREEIEEMCDSAGKGNERYVICTKHVYVEHIPWNVWTDIFWLSIKGG
jgi:hypothetical protein